MKTDPREAVTYNLGSINLTRKQSPSPSGGYVENVQQTISNKDKPSAISASSTVISLTSSTSSTTSTTTKNLASHRRELNTGLSYDETKMAMFHRSSEISSPISDVYSNSMSGSSTSIISNNNKTTAENMHLMSQNNTQTTKYNSSPYKHLVATKAATEIYDDFTPRGKAAALLGTDTTKTPTTTTKHKLSDTQIPQNQSQPARTVAHTKSRRNSDPSSNKIPLLEVNRGNDMYQSSTHINIAGHRFHKAGRIGKGEKCASCQENDAFVNEGHRCLDCKLLVHTKCIQNGGVKSLQCEKSSKRHLRKNIDKLTRNSKTTREYTDSADKIISDAKELQLMQDFIAQKIYKMDADCNKTAAVDRVFKQALREFKDNLVAQYSIAHKQKSDTLNIKYRDLISNFEQVMETCGNKNDDFPLTMCVNGFRVFMNEFMNSRETEKPKTKRKKEKKRKIDEHTNFNGEQHLIFNKIIPNIQTN